jgi:hypothetical protein
MFATGLLGCTTTTTSALANAAQSIDPQTTDLISAVLIALNFMAHL